MLNKDNIRELAYVVRVDSIEPIPGKDRVECARIMGWTCMVPKGAFRPNDLGIYFEIDSKVDYNKELFAFTSRYNGNIKTQKFKNSDGSYFYSQGLLMAAADFGWELCDSPVGKFIDTKEGAGSALEEGDFLTKKLGVVYATEEDNKRKSNSVDKYKKMAQRRPEIFKKPIVRWLMKREWGRKFMFLLFGKKKDKKNAWPIWVVKTDEERAQNIPWILEDKSEWFATEKIDGTSTTFTMKGWGRKREFYTCSRNVVFDKPNKACFYDTNVYTEIDEKYDMEQILDFLMTYFDNVDGKVEFVTVQGETYGAGIQKRDYSLTDHDFMAFNVIVGYADGTTKRLNPREMTDLLDDYNIPCVPIVDEHFILPDTIDELLAIATDKSLIDGKEREGLVFRSADGVRSFKAVSNEFLVKYHQ